MFLCIFIDTMTRFVGKAFNIEIGQIKETGKFGKNFHGKSTIKIVCQILMTMSRIYKVSRMKARLSIYNTEKKLIFTIIIDLL